MQEEKGQDDAADVRMILEYLIKKSEFSMLFRFASPSFFKVVTPSGLITLLQEIIRNRNEPSVWAKILREMQSTLDKCSAGITILNDEAEPLSATSPPSKDPAGERILKLFFSQILQQDVWIIDLRSSTFEMAPDGVSLSWRPKPFFYRPSDFFLEGIRSLYSGFYQNDTTEFRRGLKQLELEKVEDVLLTHFGPTNQSRVEFKLALFQKTFAHVFDSCAKHHTALPAEFFVLGAMLLGLYENLESSGRSFDVRQSFANSLQSARANDER